MLGKKTAILGGSFDPVHLGHIFLLHKTIQLTDYERIIIVPAALSNFKQEMKPVSSPQDRINMINLALEDYYSLYPSDRKLTIEVSDMEIKNGGVSYTYDTVVAIREKYAINQPIGLIIGDDHIERLNQWYNYDNLKNLVEFVICPRKGDSATWKKIPSDAKFIMLHTDETAPENATALRIDVRKNESYLSERVREYVRKNNLYI